LTALNKEIEDWTILLNEARVENPVLERKEIYFYDKKMKIYVMVTM